MSQEDKRQHRVKSDFGSADYYNYFLAQTGIDNISRTIFGDIIKEFNSHIRDRISKKGVEYVMPCGIGKIELRKVKCEVKFDENNNLINNLPINWKETRKLWAESQSAYDKKTKIRYTNEHTGGYTFRIFYRKSKAQFKNKSVYRLNFNREMKRQLSTSIFAGRIDAFLR